MSQQGSLCYLLQSPQAGIALSHRLFWVVHRVQAFLATNTQRSVLIALTSSNRITVTGFCDEQLAEGICGDRRDFESFKCSVGAGGSRRKRAAGAGYAGS